jgi:hypothetical protein
MSCSTDAGSPLCASSHNNTHQWLELDLSLMHRRIPVLVSLTMLKSQERGPALFANSSLKWLENLTCERRDWDSLALVC